jgi:hypothetical protein
MVPAVSLACNGNSAHAMGVNRAAGKWKVHNIYPPGPALPGTRATSLRRATPKEEARTSRHTLSTIVRCPVVRSIDRSIRSEIKAWSMGLCSERSLEPPGCPSAVTRRRTISGMGSPVSVQHASSRRPGQYGRGLRESWLRPAGRLAEKAHGIVWFLSAQSQEFDFECLRSYVVTWLKQLLVLCRRMVRQILKVFRYGVSSPIDRGTERCVN